MEWTPGGDRSDVEDRRGESGGGGFNLGGFGGIHLGIGGTLILLVLSFLFRTNLFSIFGGGTVAPAPTEASRPLSDPDSSAAEKRQTDFIVFVLNDVQHTWEQILPRQGTPYRHTKLVLFTDLTNSGCGTAQSATGPFYCPQDEKVYIDLGFFKELRDRFGAPGEFAQAYVLAHEIGHHVQKLLGIEGQVHRLQRGDPSQANPLSVKLELQADCFAGVWGHSTEQRKMVDDADVAAGLRAAAAVGDDRLQRLTTGRVSPESFTHGSSAQRTDWFRRGLQSGQVSTCDTFGAR
uniref:Metalloprotease n=1 Tax=Solibacter usitatus (strain Ellin6076) TaxID=234267 RepID=Q01S64_SOLUE